MKQYKRILNTFLAVENKVRSSSQIYPPTLPITKAEKFQRIIRRCLYLNFDLLWVRISLWLTLSLCHRTFRQQHSPNTPYFFSHLVLVTAVTHFLQQKRHCFFLFLQQSSTCAPRPDGFFWTGSCRPVRPNKRQFSIWFPMRSRERGRTGHIINIPYSLHLAQNFCL